MLLMIIYADYNSALFNIKSIFVITFSLIFQFTLHNLYFYTKGAYCLEQRRHFYITMSLWPYMHFNVSSLNNIMHASLDHNSVIVPFSFSIFASKMHLIVHNSLICFRIRKVKIKKKLLWVSWTLCQVRDNL